METKEEKKKTSRGRQMIEMKKIKKCSKLQVTFSKRRAGLFKKAGKLSCLCCVDMAVIAMSPAEKVFSFGNPSLTRSSIGFSVGIPARTLAGRAVEGVGERKGYGGGSFWWDHPVGELGLGELERYLAALEELTCKVKTRADESQQ